MNLAGLSRITNAHDVRGGMEYHLQALAEGLVQRGHQVSIFTTAHPRQKQSETINGVAYHYLPAPSGKYRAAWWQRSTSKILNSNFDLVWAEGWAGEKLARLSSRPPLVSILHGTAWSEMKTRLQQWRSPVMLALAGLMAWRHFTWRAHIRRADHVIAVSDLVAQDARRIAPDATITTIPNGIYVDRFSTNKNSAIRQELGIPATAPTLITASRLSREKGVQLAIAALGHLPQTHLIVAGKGEYERELRLAAHATAVSQRVHFVGFVPNEQLPRYFQNADLFVLPTLRHEGLPITILEAMAAGLPVVATEVGGITAAVTHRQEGLLFPIGNTARFTGCVKQLIENPIALKQMGLAARRKAEEEFSVETMVARTDSVLREVN